MHGRQIAKPRRGHRGAAFLCAGGGISSTDGKAGARMGKRRFALIRVPIGSAPRSASGIHQSVPRPCHPCYPQDESKMRGTAECRRVIGQWSVGSRRRAVWREPTGSVFGERCGVSPPVPYLASGERWDHRACLDHRGTDAATLAEVLGERCGVSPPVPYLASGERWDHRACLDHRGADAATLAGVWITASSCFHPCPGFAIRAIRSGTRGCGRQRPSCIGG
jgi:hypothetical protein